MKAILRGGQHDGRVLDDTPQSSPFAQLERASEIVFGEPSDSGAVRYVRTEEREGEMLVFRLN